VAITVEELVVSLGLDADKLKNGAQEAAEALQPVKSIVDDINKSLKGMQSGFDAFRNWNRAISGGGAGRKTSASKSKTNVPEYTSSQVYGAGKPMPEIYGMIPSFSKKEKEKAKKDDKSKTDKYGGSLLQNTLRTLNGIAPGLASVVYMAKSASDAIQVVADKIKAAALEGTQMGNMAQRIGIASKSVQGLGAVAERMGYSASNAMADLEATITGIPALAGDQLPAILAAFRIPTHDIKTGLVRDTDSILKDLFDAINVRTKGDVKEAARFAKSLGVSQDFMQIAAKGWDNFITERARLEREGVIVGENVLANLKDMNTNFQTLVQTIKSTYLTFVSSISPMTNQYLKTLTDFVQSVKGVLLDPLMGHFDNFFESWRKNIVSIFKLMTPFGAPLMAGEKLIEGLKQSVTTSKAYVKKDEIGMRPDAQAGLGTNKVNTVPESVSIQINGAGTQSPSVTWNGQNVKRSTFNNYQHPLSQ